MSKDNAIIKEIEKEVGKDLLLLDIDYVMGDTNGFSVNDNQNVIGLNLKYLKISDFSFLRELIHLNHLTLTFNKASDVYNLKKIKCLNLSSNNENFVELSLINLGIEKISFSGQLKNLTRLELIGNRIYDLSFLKELKNLSHLNLNNNEIVDLSDLVGLKKLTRLFLSENRISDASFLKELKNLTHLSLHSNEISNLSFLKELKNLTELYLNFNHFEDISIIKELKALTHLDLSNNRITNVGPLTKLNRLSYLNLSENKIAILPKSITDLDLEIWCDRNFSIEKKGIYLDENPLEDPPIEIVQKGREEVNFFFDNKKIAIHDTFTGKAALNELKNKLIEGKGKLIEFFSKDTKRSRGGDNKQDFLIKCIDELSSIIKDQSGKLEVRSCLELLREKKEFPKNDEFEVLNKLIKNENHKCLYNCWNNEQQNFFDECYPVISEWKDFFLSHTKRNARETNNDFQSLIEIVYDPDDFDSKKGETNFLAKLIVRYLKEKNLEGFYDEENIVCGDIFKEKIFDHCKSCFVFVQLIENVVFSQPGNDKENWCLLEFEEFKNWKENNAIKGCNRYFFILTGKDAIPEEDDLLRIQKNWVDTINSTEQIFFPKFKRALRDEIAKLAKEIKKTRKHIIDEYLKK